MLLGTLSSQVSISPGSEIPHLLWAPVSVFDHTHGENIFLISNHNFFHIKQMLFVPCLSAAQLWGEPASAFSAPSHEVAEASSKCPMAISRLNKPSSSRPAPGAPALTILLALHRPHSSMSMSFLQWEPMARHETPLQAVLVWVFPWKDFCWYLNFLARRLGVTTLWCPYRGHNM